MEIGFVRKVDIDHEMQQSYLDYAMSVIVARALPDARDGLKPVQRRLLYAMYDMGIRADSAYKKSARIVGEVLGKYHPHGDQAVYEAMARLAQDFSMRNPLVDGQGNFGSVDSDPPAAMRYTEARITPFAMDLLSQLDRETINFDRNFDDTLNEPSVLPSALPNLLVNGASGIAVGMATSIPPHNLGEVIDALVYLVERWDKSDDVTVADLMKYIQGPDFPTGGIILQEHDQNEIQSAYGTGRGKILLRGRVNLEEAARGKSRLIVTELPYMTNKAALIERIAELSREGQLDAVTDLRDESDRHGMRIVIELKQGAEPEKTLLALYKKTPMQVTFTINLLALVNGEPRLMTLKQALKVFVEHRLEVITRRSQFDLKKAQERLHLVEGLRIALKYLDEIIATIRAAKDTDEAKTKLMKRFKLSDIQAQAILDMPLKRLAALERKKIEDEYKQLLLTIKELQALLKSKKLLQAEVVAELMEMRQKYTDRRRTQIVFLKSGKSTSDLLTVNDVTPAEPVWVGMTREGSIGLIRGDTAPRLSGVDAPKFLIKTDTHHVLYLVNEEGKAASVAVNSIPEVAKYAEGVPYYKASPLPEECQPVGLFSIEPGGKNSPDQVVLTLSREGMIKKSLLSELPGASSQAFALAKVNQGDALVKVILSHDPDDLLVITQKGMGIRFKGDTVRAMNLLAAGVNAIKLSAKDATVDMVALRDKAELLLIASDGQGWRMDANAFPVQGRYGQGVIACRLKAGSLLTGMIYGRKTQSGTVFFNHAAAKPIRLAVIASGKRGLAGKSAVDVKTGDSILSTVMAVNALAYWGRKDDGTPGDEEDLQEETAGLESPAESEKSAPRVTVKKVTQTKIKKAAASVKVKKAATTEKAKKVATSEKVKKAATSEKPKKTTASVKASKLLTPAMGKKTASAAKVKKPAAPVSEKTEAVQLKLKGLSVPEKTKAAPVAKSKKAAVSTQTKKAAAPAKPKKETSMTKAKKEIAPAKTKKPASPAKAKKPATLAKTRKKT